MKSCELSPLHYFVKRSSDQPLFDSLDENYDPRLGTVTRPTAAGLQADLDRNKTRAAEYRAELEKCLRSWVSDYDITPQAYTPPQLGSTKDTLPQDFAYRPATRRLTELEAMNLFLLRRCELDGLERRNQPDGNDWNHPDSDGGIEPILYSGDTLDYRAVQQRAMDCHGGFSEHNKMIFEKAKPAVAALRASQGDYPYDLFPREILKRFAMNPKDLKEKPWAKDVQDKSLIEVWWPPYEVITDDYGASDLYAPGFN
ncbi:hypothetical protein EV421DRAFT_181665 [Armillaria borealis]|uniref:Uncharacterized protein n=1 Tax=Armillaria borealis TaxID=47425 RepID=A0AA39MV13_9AGAR|nr:hypothetical protein EV421DRAFT_181665 [Armillaria borealis]